ncbi:transcriptional repressor [Nakamurella antarctica]|uniref:Transcriptional repressor n=1 Tax=Nakamurella antarctica TaxID=1902245 RepID=A0A3G8ZSU6_9ACTN|nr:transcriptional repressor [Nakamurella antarctica]AZI56861.1 transcriptional repressor [Nakamurella antarctica]
MVAVQRRNTSQRAAISDLLSETGEFASAQDLHSQLRSGGSTVGLATVYRALQEMAAAGDVDSVRNESGEILYRRCAQPLHHHHLVCRSCGNTQEIDAPHVEKWARTVAQDFGFTDVDHHMELFGLCAACSGTT